MKEGGNDKINIFVDFFYKSKTCKEQAQLKKGTLLPNADQAALTNSCQLHIRRRAISLVVAMNKLTKRGCLMYFNQVQPSLKTFLNISNIGSYLIVIL